jgi:hypothetical protein
MSHSTRTLILYDSDPHYTERFLRGLKTRGRFPLRAEPARSPEDLLSLIDGNPGGILLLAEALLPTLPDAVLNRDSWRICLLCESVSRQPSPYPVIRRYQPVSGILTELLALDDAPCAARAYDAPDPWILGILPPAATSLTGAVSWLCARVLSAQRSVLYVPMESFSPCPGGKESGGEQGLSDLLFRRAHSTGTYWTPELAVRRDGLQFLPPAVNPEDIWQLSSRELGLLPQEILRQSGAEVLVVSAPCGRDPRPFFSVCRHILLPAEDTPDSRQSLQSFREYLTLQGQDELLSRTRELILPPCPELGGVSAWDPLLRHTPLGHLVEEELNRLSAG